MTPVSREWIAKAEGDFATMEREARARKNPNFDAVCFHAQQCAEKYLKAVLIKAGLSFPKTHDLVVLLDLVLPVEPLWESCRANLGFLSGFAVAFRYPGDSATHEHARLCRKYCRSFRLLARQSLRLPP